MKQILNLRAIIPPILFGLTLAALPVLYFPYLAVLSIAMQIFLAVWVLDFVFKTGWRKPVGLVLIRMFVIAIAALLYLALIWWLRGGE